jgi:hypothetical protein
VVAADLDINRAVELDAGHFRAGEKMPDVAVVNDISSHGAECAAEAADDPRSRTSPGGRLASEATTRMT